MNNPNPFVPQGSLVEQMNKKRARVKMAVVAILSGTILLIAPVLLIQGCKRDQSAQDNSSPDNTQVADTNTTPDATAAAAAATASVTNSSNNATMTMAPAPAPVAPAPVAEAPAAAASTYVVVAHDTLATIAKKFNVKLKDLQAANPSVEPKKLSVGYKLNIPASASGSASTMAATDSSGGEDVYTVKAGDNLTKIAHNAGTTYKAIMDLNNLTTTRINVGQKLKLPAKTTTASTVDTMPATTTTASNPTSGTAAIR